MAAVAAIAFAASAAGIPVRGSFGAQVTGDEPEYLLTAISLAEDADLNIADERASGRYRAFHEADLPAQAKRRPGPEMVSPHDPLLSVLLALPVKAGGWVGAKIFMALVAAALAAATLWVAVARFSVSLNIAAMLTAMFAASAPLAVYGSQIYPELPAALAIVVAAGALTGRLSAGATTLLFSAVVALPWLGIKYAPPAALLAASGLVSLVRSGKKRAAGFALAALGAAAVAYLVSHQQWYGGWTVYAAGEHFADRGEFSVMGADPDLAARSARLIGLLVDRKFGLAAWQPAWLLAVPALVVFLRRKPPGTPLVALPLLAGWTSAAFAAVTMHGWWWPGRHVVAVLPLAVLAICWWADRNRRIALAAGGTAALGVFNYIWTLSEGLRGDISWAVRFFETSSPLYRLYRTALPDYMQTGAAKWTLHFAWAAAAAAAAAAAYLLEKRSAQNTSGSR